MPWVLAFWVMAKGSQIPKFMGHHGAHLGPVGPGWAPCWPHEPCYQGYSCNKSGMLCLKTLWALVVQVWNQWSWFWPHVSISYESLLNVNNVPKYSGSDLFTNLYQNFIRWASNISLTFSIPSPLNNCSVWALYLLCLLRGEPVFVAWTSCSTQNPSMCEQLQMG